MATAALCFSSVVSPDQVDWLVAMCCFVGDIWVLRSLDVSWVWQSLWHCSGWRLSPAVHPRCVTSRPCGVGWKRWRFGDWSGCWACDGMVAGAQQIPRCWRMAHIRCHLARFQQLIQHMTCRTWLISATCSLTDRVPTQPWKFLNFFFLNSRPWKFYKKGFGPRKSLNLSI